MKAPRRLLLWALSFALVLALAAAIAILVRGEDREVNSASRPAEASRPPAEPSPAPALDQLVDVGERAGLPQGLSSWGIAAGPVFGEDGDDLVVSYHDDIRVYRNEGGTLVEAFRPELSDPHACAVADVTGNGLGDIYCTRGGGAWKETTTRKSNGLWLQDPAGVFSENVAADFGVADPLGRGRHPMFIDLDGDDYPDLFVGNHSPRDDGKPSPNRTFVNEGGERFREVRIGLTGELGAFCVQAVDVEGDEWEDLLVCGNERLHLFRSEPSPTDARRFRDVAPDLGIDLALPRSAWLADFDGDGRLDLAVVHRDRVQVLLRRDDGFTHTALDRPLEEGTWLAVGDVDGEDGPDLYVVQGCRDDRNLKDLLLMNDGGGGFREVDFPSATTGCGDVARMVDLDGDGRDEILVLNGRPVGTRGPVQVLTLSPALAP